MRPTRIFNPDDENQVNNPPSVWLQIGRFIRLPYDLIRGRRPFADQAHPGADGVKEQTEGHAKAAELYL